jgi:hypothetical protein
VTPEADGIASKGFATSAAGETVAEWGSDAVELWALGLALPGSLFFLSLLGWRPSLSLDAILWNRMGSLRSFVGVVTSGA